MKRLVSIMAVICLLGNIMVSAAEITNVSVSEKDIENGEIIISGELAESLTESTVSVIVCDPQVTVLNQTAEALLPYVKGIGEDVTENQNFSISIFLPESANSGDYSFFVSGENMETVYKSEFYISPFEAKRKLKELNEATADLEAKFTAYCDCTGISYQEINAENFDKDSFFEKILASRPESGFGGLEEVASYFKACLGLQKLESMENATERQEYIISNANELMISQDGFEAFDENIRLQICEGLSSSALLSPQILQAYIFEKGVLCSFEQAEVWNTFKELVEEYPQYFELSDSESEIYEDISDKNAVFKLMFTNKPETDYTLEGLKELYIESINEQSDAENDKKSSSKGSSGGSGGGSKITFDRTVSEITPEKTDVFTDIENVAWAKDAIIYLNQKGIIKGVGDGRFLPDKQITREEFVKIIVEAFGLQNGDKNVAFEDVNENAWYAPYIYAAVNAGVINGIGDNCFGIGRVVTRQDMAAMIYRAAKNNGINFKSIKNVEFDDFNTVKPYAEEAVASLAKAGIINGISENEFAPDNTTTRAQAAKVIYGVLSEIAG